MPRRDSRLKLDLLKCRARSNDLVGLNLRLKWRVWAEGCGVETVLIEMKWVTLAAYLAVVFAVLEMKWSRVARAERFALMVDFRLTLKAMRLKSVADASKKIRRYQPRCPQSPRPRSQQRPHSAGRHMMTQLVFKIDFEICIGTKTR